MERLERLERMERLERLERLERMIRTGGPSVRAEDTTAMERLEPGWSGSNG